MKPKKLLRRTYTNNSIGDPLNVFMLHCILCTLVCNNKAEKKENVEIKKLLNDGTKTSKLQQGIQKSER